MRAIGDEVAEAEERPGRRALFKKPADRAMAGGKMLGRGGAPSAAAMRASYPASRSRVADEPSPP